MSDNCRACASCFIEPSDMNFTCGHPDAGSMGIYIQHAVAKGGHCGPDRPKFRQHPLRYPDGNLRSHDDRIDEVFERTRRVPTPQEEATFTLRVKDRGR